MENGDLAECAGVAGTVAYEPKPHIFARQLASSGVNVEVAGWTGSTPLEQRQSPHKVTEAMKAIKGAAGIGIAFPYRALTFKDAPPRSDVRGDADDTAE